MNGSKQTTGALGLVLGLFVVLGVLAVLQYRWTGDLSTAERDRMRRFVGESARRLSQEFDSSFIDVIERLGPDPMSTYSLEEQVVAASYDLETTSSRMLTDVWILRLEPHGIAPTRLDLETLEWTSPDPPDFIRRLDVRGMAGGRGFRLQPLLSEVPALVIPAGQPRDVTPGPPNPRPGGPGPSALIVAVLNREFISSQLMPDLVERYFGVDESRAWSIEVRDRATDQVVYRSDVLPNESPPDLETGLFGIRQGNLAPGPEGKGRSPRGPGVPGAGRGFRGPRMDSGNPEPTGPWTMRIWHRDGSLEAAVERSRLRNLALSAGVLALLLAGGLVIIANAHRSRELARQQLDFVAAVTHELNTPIAAISSAGQNLSDGVVKEESQIRRYGSMIEREGRRLASMVEQVLEFAGMQRGAPPLTMSRVLLEDIVEQAISSTAWMIEENEVTVERELRDGDAELGCDRDEIIRALANLIGNAIKYRGNSNRIVVSARMDSDDAEAVFSVKDEGLGISTEDQRRIFEPFVRGSNARDGAIRGSGLGLSIVRRIAESHGGRVEVDSRSGKGSLFSLRIPTK